MDWMTILKVLGPAVAFIAIFMEAYKKNIRQDKAKAWENWLIGGILSITFSIVGYLSFDLPGKPISMIYYALCVFALQLVVDMKIIKSLVKVFLKKKGFTEEELEDIIDVDDN